MKVKAIRKPAPLKFAGEILPTAYLTDDGELVTKPRIYYTSKEAKRFWNWLGTALNWMAHHEEVQKLKKAL
jgi:hypothetical protein